MTEFSAEKIITIDCREMEHPEPLITVLAAVDKLKDDEVIKMVHRRVPYPLFEHLQQKNMDYNYTRTELESGEHVEVLIRKKLCTKA